MLNHLFQTIWSEPTLAEATWTAAVAFGLLLAIIGFAIWALWPQKPPQVYWMDDMKKRQG